MGSTVVVALFVRRSLVVAHIGDSRAYLFRDGTLSCLTQDHNVAAIMYQAGLLDTAERSAHSGRFALSQYVGMRTDISPAADWFPIRPLDRILLCTDGLTEMLSDEDITDSLSADCIHHVCRELVQKANDAGGRDNITVAVAEVPPRGISSASGAPQVAWQPFDIRMEPVERQSNTASRP